MGIPLVALGVHAPDPLQQAGAAMQLRSMGQQTAQQAAMAPGQLEQQQQQTQAGAMQLQQQQQAIKDQQAMTDAWKQWDGKDPNQLPQLVVNNGGSGQAAQQTVQHVIDVRQKAAQTAKDDAAANTDNATAKQKEADQYRGRTMAIVAAPADQQQDLWDKEVTAEETAGKIQPGEVSHTYPGNDKAKIIANHFALGSVLQKEAIDQQEANQKDWKDFPAMGVALNTRTGEVKTPAGQMLSPEAMAAKYVSIQQKQRLGQAVTPEEKAFTGAYANFKELVPAATFNMNQGAFANPVPIKPGSVGQDALSQMDPKIASMVKMVGDYKQKSSEITQRMPPAAKANFLSALNSAYPNYDENEFPARNKMVTSFTSGPESKSINAVNTALSHVGVLNDAIDALNNGDVRIINSFANRLGLEVGSTPAATFKTIVHRVGPELAAAYIQGGGGEGERGTTQADFDVNLPPQTLKGNIGITAKLLRGKIAADENQWNTTMKPGTPDQEFSNRFLTPEAKKTLDKLAPTGGAQGGGQSGGGAPSAKTLSSVQIQQAAKDHGVSVDEATRQAKAAGYIVK